MYLEISPRRTGKTTRLVKAVIASQAKTICIVAGFYAPFLTNGAWYSPLVGIIFGLIGFLNFWGFIR